MKIVADLHIHSKYSRAVSQEMTLENIALWAKKKGIQVMGTGDFTHPQWFDDIKTKLEPAENGLYNLKSQISNLKSEVSSFKFQDTRFMLTAEISSIYSKGGKVRRIHNLIFAPSIEAVEKINTKLGWIGNLKADGRPILGLDSKELLKIILEADEKCVLIPAHAWTPWFSIFGSMSGFDSIEECFEEMSPHIFAIETGLSCYDEKTEVLAESGWKKFADVRQEDKICTLNISTEEIEYQKPQEIYHSKYRGKMYRLKTKRADLLVTPNHNLLYAPVDFRVRRPYRLKEVRSLFGKSKILRKDGIWKGENLHYFTLPEVKIQHGSRFYSGFRTKKEKTIPIKQWLKFFGFWIAEGWTTKGNNGDYAVCISNKNYELMTEMKHILESFGYSVFWDKKTTNTIRVRDYQLFHYLKQFGKASEKHLPMEIKTLSSKLLEIFLQYYLKGDGHVYGRNGKGRSATTISIRLRDDLQEIALKTGDSAYYKLLRKKGSPSNSPSQKKQYYQSADSWNIYFIRHNRHAIIPSTMKKYGYKEQWVDYDGMVYCVSVPNHTVYIRRNGIPLWCGNSDPAMNWRLSSLDKISLISNSDSHSLQKLGREANVFDCELSYRGIIDAIRSKDPKKFLYTIEFFPEEGKYHYDGHRDCRVSFPPDETEKHRMICPVCGKQLTVGVLNRVAQLADLPAEAVAKAGRIPFKNLIPLDEIIGEAMSVGPKSKKVMEEYEKLVSNFGSELNVLEEVSYDEISRVGNTELGETIKRVREGRVIIKPGYDGEYGKISIFTEDEKENILSGRSQSSLF
ncbi:MAG: LAGLIDADG family homing endonuclease [Patescibacteria group bacterium]